MSDKRDVEALASLLEGSGMLEGMSGGKRSHKGQYVRWLIGNIVKKNPKARVGDEGGIFYKPPYNPPFAPSRIKPESVSERFGTVARSKFINKMLEAEKGKAKAKKPVVAPAQPKISGIQSFFGAKQKAKSNIANKVDYRKAVISLSKEGMTTRAIKAKIDADYDRTTNIPNSQPTITRIVKKYREGGYNEDGTEKK